MNLKKKIMLVVSMAIMTLSIFLSDLSVLAASSSMSGLIIYRQSLYDSPWFYGPEITIREAGQSVLVDGTVYSYLDDNDDTVKVTLNATVDLSQFLPDNKREIVFSSSAQSIIWDLYGSLNYGYLVDTAATSSNIQVRMALEKLTFNIYNKSYIIPFGSNTNVGQPNSTGSTLMEQYIHIDELPVNKMLSKYDIGIEATFSISYSIVDYDYYSFYTIRPRFGYMLNYFAFYEVYVSNTVDLGAVLSALNEIKLLIGQNNVLHETYLPKLNQILILLQSSVVPDVEQILYFTEVIVDELENANLTLDSIDSVQKSLDSKFAQLLEMLEKQSSSDKNVTDGFKQDSDSQSNQLNNLNQQSQPDKIDVDNASGVVDQNLNINTDANYGVLLSTFTSNGKILTMLLAVSSIGLVSYVLFGKR